MELTYRIEGDYLIPNLTLPAEEAQPVGRYGRLRRHYLKQHLAEIDQTAAERTERMVAQMAAQRGVTEALKAADQMAWVGQVNWSGLLTLGVIYFSCLSPVFTTGGVMIL